MHLICWSLIVNTLTSAAQNNSSRSSSQWATLRTWWRTLRAEPLTLQSNLELLPVACNLTGKDPCVVYAISPVWFPSTERTVRAVSLWVSAPELNRSLCFASPSLRLWNFKRETAAARWCVTFLLPLLNSHGCAFTFYFLLFPSTASVRRHSQTYNSSNSGFLC